MKLQFLPVAKFGGLAHLAVANGCAVTLNSPRWPVGLLLTTGFKPHGAGDIPKRHEATAIVVAGRLVTWLAVSWLARLNPSFARRPPDPEALNAHRLYRWECHTAGGRYWLITAITAFNADLFSR